MSEQHSDRKNAPSIKVIDRFRCDTNVGGEKAVAKITVKETLVDGNKIYSVELEALEKPADLNENTRNSQSTGSNDSTETTGNPSSTNGFSESSSTSTVPQNQQNVKGKLKSIIIGGEKYYIADTPNASRSSGKKKTNEHAEQEPRAKYSRDAENQLDNQGENTENEDEIITDYAELE